MLKFQQVSRLLILISFGSGAVLAPASAALIGLTGNIATIPHPVSVQIGDLQDNNTAFVFEENKGVVYPGYDALVTSQAAADRGLDFLIPLNLTETEFIFFSHTLSGFVDGYSDLVPGRPAIGTRLDSYFLHFEPTPTSSGTPFFIATGTLTFDEDILGVQTNVSDQFARLELAELLMEVSGTNYNRAYTGSSGGHGGFDPEGVGPLCDQLADNFEISSDRRSLSFCFSANGDSDQLRIITASSAPEPVTLALLALGLAGLGLSRGRSRKS